MKISEVMELTGLTKKAINYYEGLGLINPAFNKENNYREYSQQEVDRLIQISILRQIDVPLKDIKNILSDNTKIKSILEVHIMKLENQIKSMETSKNILKACLSGLENNFNDLSSITSELSTLNNSLRMDSKGRSDYMQKQLHRIFPGNFGKLISYQYGAFLDEPLDTPEKEAAWISIVKHLDDVEDFSLPEDIENLYNNLSDDYFDKVEENMNSMIHKMISFSDQEFEKYISDIIDKLNETESFKSEIASVNDKYFESEMLIKSKMKAMGYYDKFENNLKALSPKYALYVERAKYMENCIAKAFGIDISRN